MRRDLQTRRRHFFNKKVSMVNYLSSQTKPEEMLVDDSATATVNVLSDKGCREPDFDNDCDRRGQTKAAAQHVRRAPARPD